MRRPANRLRRGWTLVELLVVLTIVTVLLTSITVTIQKIVWQNGAFGNHVIEQRAFVCLAEQFRGDVHTAVRIEELATATQGEGKAIRSIRCSCVDGPPVFYQLQGCRLVRTATDGEGRATHRCFAVPQGATVRLRQDDGARPRVAVLEIEYPGGCALPVPRSSQASRRQRTIEAVVGRDVRWRPPDEVR